MIEPILLLLLLAVVVNTVASVCIVLNTTMLVKQTKAPNRMLEIRFEQEQIEREFEAAEHDRIRRKLQSEDEKSNG